MFLAKALFDNVAETPEELAFRRGDVITVVAEHAGHVPSGWWLCSFRGRQGLAPANRLKILSSLLRMEETNQVFKDQERAESATRLKEHPSDRLQDYDVPPSRYTPSTTPSPVPADTSLYDVPSHRPAPPCSGARCAARNSTAAHATHAKNLLCANPAPSKRSSTERKLQRRSCASVDSLLSTSFQSLSGDPQQRCLGKLPTNRKRWSADCGSLMLLGKVNMRLPARDGDDWRFTGKTLTDSHHRSPRSSRQDSVRSMLPEDQTVYSVPPSCNAAEFAEEAIYDTPNPFTNLPPTNTGKQTVGRGLSDASNNSCLSVSSSRLVSSRRQVVSDARLSDSGLSGAGASFQGTRRLSSRQSCPSHWLSLDPGSERVYDTPAPCSQPPSRAGTPTPLEDGSKRDGSHGGIKTTPGLHPYHALRHSASESGLKSARPDCGHASAVCYYPDLLYDNPSQVTRHSTISDSNSSEDSNRLSSCSMDSFSSGAEYYCLVEGVYEELHLDQDSAIQLLIKLQGEVTESASRLLMFVSSEWRTKEFLQSNLHGIKIACTELKKSMTKFVEFAQRTLVNSTQLSDRKLVSRLIKQVDHLQKQLKGLNEALGNLHDMQWEVTRLAESVTPDHEDPLERVICLAKHLTPDVKKLVSFIHGNGSLLFKRSSDGTELSDGPVPVGGMTSHRERKAEPRSTSVQMRPLPPLPKSARDKQLPPDPAQHAVPSHRRSDSQNNLIDKVSVLEEDLQRCTVAVTDNDSDRDYSDLQGDYDYVQLETCVSAAQQKSKMWPENVPELQKHLLKNIVEGSESPDILTTVKNRNFMAMEKISAKDTSFGIMTKPIHHTERMFASFNAGKHPDDVHHAPTNQNTFETRSACKDVPKDHSNSHSQDPRTPVYTMNGSITSIRKPLSGSTGVINPPLGSGDKQVLCYYSGQVETRCTLLINAIDTFIACVQDREPPQVFISNSKFVIVTAYKLIYIGHALHRRLVHVDLRERVLRCAGQLCECLRVGVQATKTAALQFPSVTAVQCMVDRVVDVSHAAHELRLVITQASSV